VSYLDIAFGATLGGDVRGPYGANTVYNLLNVPLPPLTINGYLHYIPGTGLVLDTPGTSGTTLISVDYTLTLANGTNTNVNLSAATGNTATVAGPTLAYTISTIVGKQFAYYWSRCCPASCARYKTYTLAARPVQGSSRRQARITQLGQILDIQQWAFSGNPHGMAAMALGRWSSVRLVLVLVIACAGCWERHDVSVTADAGHKRGTSGRLRFLPLRRLAPRC